MTWNRIAGAAGLVSVLIAFVEVGGPSFPLTSDSASAIADSFTNHHGWVLLAVAVQGFAATLYLVFACGLGVALYAAEARFEAVTAVVAAAVSTALSLTGLAIIAALGYGVAANADAQTTKGLFMTASLGLTLTNWLIALMMAATAAAVLQSAALPRWYGLASLVTAIVLSIGALTFARDGFFAPDGDYTFFSYGVELLWTATTGVLLMRLDPDGHVTARPSLRTRAA
jgi:hypothetical protein